MVVPFDFFHISSPMDKKKGCQIYFATDFFFWILYIVRKVFKKNLPTKNLKKM